MTVTIAPAPAPALASLPETRREILRHIKKRGEAAAEDIAVAIGITPSGTRQHLSGLERDGLIAHLAQREGRDQPNRPGRPKYLYALTPVGDTLFPRRYAELADELLTYVEDEDPALLERIFDRRARRRLEGTRARIEGLPFEEQVRVVARVLDEDGYLADMTRRDDGAYIITEHNCAVLSIAQRHGHACGSELAYLQAALPRAEVTRIAHRLNGGHVCAYEVKPRMSKA